MGALVCPVCGEELLREEMSFRCKNRHSFDISAKGYVNLLLPSQMNAKLPGDNKLMVNARADFLSRGYYSHLAECMCGAVKENFTGNTLLDAGCGEGYYTEKLYSVLPEGSQTIGIDISKFACRRAAVRFKGKNCIIAVGSVFRLPVGDSGADMAVSMFAPFCREELFRVLKPYGTLIMAIPAPRHLMELKTAIYDEPYENETGDYNIEGFDFMGKKECSRRITLDSPRDIQSLFAMTPYYYKTSREGHERAERLLRLETEAAFEVLIYKKH